MCVFFLSARFGVYVKTQSSRKEGRLKIITTEKKKSMHEGFATGTKDKYHNKLSAENEIVLSRLLN